MPLRTPSYRLHKPTGQAVVTLNGRDHYLGKHGTPESRTHYDRLLAEWLSSGRQLARPTAVLGSTDLSVAEMILAYVRFAEQYYRKAGKPTKEVANIKLAMRPLKSLYGRTEAGKFGPLALKAVRQEMVEAGICRLEINRRVGRIVRAFKWAVENELVPPSVHESLKAVPWLRKGRSEARESPPVRPVPDEHVDAVRPHVSRQVWALIELQRLSGARPGEVCRIRPRDLDMTGTVWVYTPDGHKTEHHGRDRRIYFGPQAQTLLKGWLGIEPDAYLFSPTDAMTERWAEQRRTRKTPLTPSQRERTRKRRPSKTPGRRYTTDSYRQAIVKACAKAGVPAWHPHQLRHNAATRLRKEFGLDVARVILGHSSPAVTEVYAEVDQEKARDIMARVG